jgi:hypothetical protein
MLTVKKNNIVVKLNLIPFELRKLYITIGRAMLLLYDPLLYGLRC